MNQQNVGDLAGKLLRASNDLIVVLEAAIAVVQATPEQQQPAQLAGWQERGLPNLRDYRRGLEAAIGDLERGRSHLLHHNVSVHMGLAKQVDALGFDWASPNVQGDIDRALDRVVGLARQIWDRLEESKGQALSSHCG